MKKLLHVILLLLPVYSYADVQIKELPLSGFSQLSLTGPMDIQIIQGDEEKLIIRGEAKFIDFVEPRIKDDVLIITLNKQANNASDVFSNSSQIQLKLHVKTLTRVDNLGSGDVYFKNINSDTFALNVNGSGNAAFNTLQAKQFSVALAGSGDIKIVKLMANDIQLATQGSGDIAIAELTADTLKVALGGSGDLSIKLASTTQSQTIVLTGSGDYSAKELTSFEARLSLMGSGDAEVHATDNLYANVLGSGDVVYHGNPVITQTTSGSGEIISAQ